MTQRGNTQSSSQTFRVLVDGVEVGRYTPASTSYESFATPVFHLEPGLHTLAFEGLNPQGGDNTAFLDEVRLFSL